MICTKCNCDKKESEFRRRPSLKRGYTSWCRSCENEANKAKYTPKEKNVSDPIDSEMVKLEAKKRMLKHRYELSYEVYLQMYEDQNKLCPICEKEFKLGGKKGLYVDHCHKTKLVRGLLCSGCNTAIGILSEDKKIFENAMKYLGINC